MTYHQDSTPSGVACLWFTSKRAAMAGIRELRDNYPNNEGAFFIYDGQPELVIVPNIKTKLVQWLNIQAASL